MARGRTCSLVILNHNGGFLLEKYLPGVIKAARRGGHEVVVVDNVSTDGSPSLARKLGADLVLERPVNEFLISLNYAAQLSSCEHLVILNNDLDVEPDFCEPLLEHFDDPAVFSVGCKVLDPDRRRVQMGRVSGRFSHGLIDPVYHIEQHLDPDDCGPLPTLYTPGGACAVNRLKFLELGGFHRLMLPIYYEDLDLGYAAWRRGWRCIYDPRSVVVHLHAATTSRMFSQEWLDKVKLKNRIMVTLKNVTDRKILAACLRTCLWYGRKSVRPGQSWMRKALFHLVRQSPELLSFRNAWKRQAIVPDRVICPVYGEPSEPTLVGFHAGVNAITGGSPSC